MISGSRVYDPRICRICQKTCFKIIHITFFLLILGLWAISFPMSLFTTKEAFPFDLGYFLGFLLVGPKLLFLLLFLDLLTGLNSSNSTNHMNLLTFAFDKDLFCALNILHQALQGVFLFVQSVVQFELIKGI